MNESLVTVTSLAPHVPNLTLVNTSRMNDNAPSSEFTFSCQPGYPVYSSEVTFTNTSPTSYFEFPIVFENSPNQDPFVINPMPSEHEQSKPFMNTTRAGRGWPTKLLPVLP